MQEGGIVAIGVRRLDVHHDVEGHVPERQTQGMPAHKRDIRVIRVMMSTVSNGIDREIQTNRMGLGRQEADQMAEATSPATAYLKHVFSGKLSIRSCKQFYQLSIKL